MGAYWRRWIVFATFMAALSHAALAENFSIPTLPYKYDRTLHHTISFGHYSHGIPDRQEAKTQIELAFDRWNYRTGSQFDYTVDNVGDHLTDTWPPHQGNGNIYFWKYLGDRAPAGEFWGWPHPATPWRLIEGDIVMNTLRWWRNCNLTDHDFSHDIARLGLHEVGHWCGADHSSHDYKNSVMGSPIDACCHDLDDLVPINDTDWAFYVWNDAVSEGEYENDFQTTPLYLGTLDWTGVYERTEESNLGSHVDWDFWSVRVQGDTEHLVLYIVMTSDAGDESQRPQIRLYDTSLALVTAVSADDGSNIVYYETQPGVLTTGDWVVGCANANNVKADDDYTLYVGLDLEPVVGAPPLFGQREGVTLRQVGRRLRLAGARGDYGRLDLFAVDGRRVTVLHEGGMSEDSAEFSVPMDLTAGVYFARWRGAESHRVTKLVTFY